jgi:hypothetical protein
MKNVTLFLLFLISSALHAQKTDECPVKIQVGECVTKSTYLLSKDDKSLKAFVLEVPQDGDYYLEALLLVSGNAEYEVLIDEKTSVGSFKSASNRWQFASLLNAAGSPQLISLNKGPHTVSFSAAKPFVPLVDAVALSRTEAGTLLNQKPAMEYLTKLAQTKLPDNYEVDKKSRKSNKRIQTNPEGQYEYNIDYSYSTTSTFQYWLQGGLPYTFKTEDTNTDPVMYIFYSSDPTQGS